jgi:hypothetical protein
VFDGQFVFSQLMDVLPRREFNACVGKYGGNRCPRGFSCRDQFLCLAFAQLTYRESLRDIETCLRAFGSKLYHAGFRGQISRSTLADANRMHDWRIYVDFAQVLIRRARKLYASEPLAVELQQTVYALDSTTSDRWRLVFLTNNFALPALVIARLYKSRWQVELFFKWIKQHLRIKAFYGTSENAVKTQVWVAISVYVLVAILKLKLERSLYEILQILSVTLFEKMPIFEALRALPVPNSDTPFPNQLTLFDL